MSTFHLKDGLFFEALPFGDLRIILTTDGKTPGTLNIAFDTTVCYSQTASIMAFACARGYTTDTFFQAYEFLKAHPTPAPTLETPNGNE